VHTKITMCVVTAMVARRLFGQLHMGDFRKKTFQCVTTLNRLFLTFPSHRSIASENSPKLG